VLPDRLYTNGAMVVASLRNHANLHTYSLQSSQNKHESRTSACFQHVRQVRDARIDVPIGTHGCRFVATQQCPAQ
jgi:hypothetical protein